MEQIATYWVERVVEALGRAPQTPEEALGVLGALLRSDPAEKEEFIRQAHLAWVGGGWAVKGDPSPEARVVLTALVEATRRLAERYGWKRGGSSPRLRVTEEVAQRVRIGEAEAKGSSGNIFRVGPKGLSQKALWRAAYLVAQGEEVVLVGPLAAKARQLVLAKAARVLARAKARDVVRMPWGEEVPLFRGDRWEDLSLPEPRIAAALRELREILEERQEEEVEEGAREPWAHQVRISPIAIKRLWGEVDPEAKGVETVYLQDRLEVLDLLDGVEVDVYHPEELHRVLGIAPGSRPRRPEGWRRMLEGIARYGRSFTYAEVKEVFGRKRRDWGLYRLLQAPVAWEVEALGFRDPESAFQEGILKGLLVGRRWRLGEVNPMVYLLAEIRKHLLELRAREVGVFRLPWEKARAVRRYFALVHKHGLPSEEAAKRAGLPPEVREALLGGEVSVEVFLEVGVDPTGEEVDYDTYLLKRKVEELRVEVGQLWGAPGEEFLELLLDGVAPYAAAYQLGLGAEFAEEVTAYLRGQLESWVA